MRFPSILPLFLWIVAVTMVRAPWVVIQDSHAWALPSNPDTAAPPTIAGHVPMTITTDTSPPWPPPSQFVAFHVKFPAGSRECNQFTLDAGLAFRFSFNHRRPSFASAYIWRGDAALNTGGFVTTGVPYIWSDNVTLPMTLRVATGGAGETLVATHRFVYPNLTHGLTASSGYWFGLAIGIDRAPHAATGSANELRWLFATEPINTSVWHATSPYRTVDRFGNGRALTYGQLANWTGASMAEPWLSMPMGSSSMTGHVALTLYGFCAGPTDANNPVVLPNGIPAQLYDPSVPPLPPPPLPAPLPAPSPSTPVPGPIPTEDTSPTPGASSSSSSSSPQTTTPVGTPMSPSATTPVVIVETPSPGSSPTIGSSSSTATPVVYPPSPLAWFSSPSPVPTPVPTSPPSKDSLWEGESSTTHALRIALWVTVGAAIIILLAVCLYCGSGYMMRRRTATTYERVEELDPAADESEKQSQFLRLYNKLFGHAQEASPSPPLLHDLEEDNNNSSVDEEPMVPLGKDADAAVEDDEEKKLAFMAGSQHDAPHPPEAYRDMPAAAASSSRDLTLIPLDKQQASGDGAPTKKKKKKGGKDKESRL